MKRLMGIALGLLVLAGCDKVGEMIPLSDGKAVSEASSAAARQREADEEAERLNAERAAVEQHLKAMCRALETERAAFQKRSDEAVRDRDLLAGRIRTLTPATNCVNKLKRRHDVLLALLGDEGVNGLARKYLGRDFRLVSLAFEERMQSAFDDRRARQSALKRNRSEYETTVRDAQGKTDQSTSSASSGRDGVRREIEVLSRKERDLQRSLGMVPANLRRQRENELRDVSNKLRNLQAQYDSLRVVRNVEEGKDRASRQKNDDIDRAQRRLDQADKMVLRQYDGTQSPSDVLSLHEAETVGALEHAIDGVLRQQQSKTESYGACLEYVRAVSTGLDKLNSLALRSLRQEADARVAKVRSSEE